MRFSFRLLLIWMLLFFFILSPILPAAGQDNSFDPARQKAVDMLARLTPEERVGQLFVVTFTGTTVDERSEVYDLVVNGHVGGLVLTRSNDNFNNTEDIRRQIYQLTSSLQETEWTSSQTSRPDPATGVSFSPQYIPMFVGISQDGDLFPSDQVLSGITDLPSLMSVGATWDTNLAEQVGEIMGQEMAALGFNFYLGPSLDVLDDPQNTLTSDLGVQTFGGDPYWVSKMGQAYITGLHTGSENRLAVIAKHFPGRGSSDRSPDEEIATVRKSLDQLKQVELAPFFAVAGNSPSVAATTDGVMVSHIRYQGFQNNIRATTRPVSLDSSALDLILKLPELATWRQNAGLTVSDDLGSPAVRRFYETSGTFDPLQAAREAFYAGNDLLYMDRFIAPNDPNVYTTIQRTLQFFAQKYRSDPEFARRVDAAVERILTVKYSSLSHF